MNARELQATEELLRRVARPTLVWRLNRGKLANRSTGSPYQRASWRRQQEHALEEVLDAVCNLAIELGWFNPATRVDYGSDPT